MSIGNKKLTMSPFLTVLLVSLVVQSQTSQFSTMGEQNTDNIPRQMKRLYRQYKRGLLPDNGINTVRYIQPYKGSITSSGNLLFNLDAIHKQETVLKAELHFFRKTDQFGYPLIVDLSEISPHYLTLIQHEEVTPDIKGWVALNVTSTVRQCINTVVTNYQVGVKFTWEDKNNDPVDMKRFLRHHSVPFLLVFSNDTWSLEMDQIKARNGLNAKQMVDEMNEMIDPETGNRVKHVYPKRFKRDIFDNEIPGDPDIERRKKLDRQMNHISIKWSESAVGSGSQLTTRTNDLLPETQTVNSLLPDVDMDILKPRRKSKKGRKNKKHKNRKSNLLPWPVNTKKEKRKPSKSSSATFPSEWLDKDKQDDNNNMCGRKRLTVNFEDLGWGKRIIEPKTFEAFYCSGQCSFPFSLDLHTTNHASLQSLLNAINVRSDVPQPCCVPDKLSSVSLLYYDHDNNVVLKNYPDMTVESCSCR